MRWEDHACSVFGQLVGIALSVIVPFTVTVASSSTDHR